jgi:acyl-CoA synthetase (AMP-forming)/AMP-acid ligase II
VSDPHRTLTFGDLAGRLPRLAAALLARAGGPGERVMVSLADGVSYVEAYLAGFLAGVPLFPVHPDLEAGTIAEAVRRVDPSAVVSDRRGAAAARVALGSSPRALARFELGGPDDDWERAAAGPAADAPPPGPDAIAALFLTSGTTASPKAVVVTHRNWNAGLIGLAAAFGPPAGDDVLWHVTPLSHTTGELIVPALEAGALQRIVPDGDLAAAAAHLSRGEGTRLFLFAPLLGDLLAQIRRFPRPPRLRSILYGGAPAPLPVIDEALDRLGPVLEQGYGQTETFPPTVALRRKEHLVPGEAGRRLRGSLGRPVGTCEVRLVGSDGTEPVAVGMPGEIAVRGGNVTPGYFRDEAATRRARRGDFFLTGDLAVRDGDGALHLLGRRAEVFRVDGVERHARRVEREGEGVRGVREAALCEVAGEAVLAVASGPEAGADLAERVARALAVALPAGTRPSRVVVLDRLPRNPNRKLRRDRLAAMLAAADAPRREDRP